MARKTQKTSARPKPRVDKYRAVLEFDSRDEVAEFNRAYPLVNEVASRIEPDGRLRLTFHLTQSQIKELAKDGYAAEVIDNVSEIGRERQKEVGKGDRFDGGRIPPEPRGLPRREES